LQLSRRTKDSSPIKRARNHQTPYITISRQ
jgi:hypothetical protein